MDMVKVYFWKLFLVLQLMARGFSEHKAGSKLLWLTDFVAIHFIE